MLSLFPLETSLDIPIPVPIPIPFPFPFLLRSRSRSHSCSHSVPVPLPVSYSVHFPFPFPFPFPPGSHSLSHLRHSNSLEYHGELLPLQQQVGFRQVTDNAVKIPENIRTLMDPMVRKRFLWHSAIHITEHSVQGVAPMLIRFDRKFTHFIVWVFVPVANAILEVVKISVCWVM